MTVYDISIENCAVTLGPALGLPSDTSLIVRYGLIRVALPLVDARRPWPCQEAYAMPRSARLRRRRAEEWA